MGASSSRRASKKGPRAAPASSVQTWPLCGVSIDYLRSVIKKKPKLAKKTVGYFVTNVIKPLTKDKSFAEHARLDPALQPLVKDQADFFLSYAWSYTLGQIVSALEGEDGFMWMDALVVNQHIHGSLTPEVLKEVFGVALKKIGSVRMIVAPWKDPTNTRRIWCVFEQLQANVHGVPVQMLFTQEDKENFKKVMIDGASMAFFHGVFAGVNVAKAQATVDADREAILTLVREFGETAVNNLVMLGLKDWLVLSGKGFGFAPDTKEAASLMNSLGCLHQSMVRC